jgi:hypothetical protein
VVLAAVAEVLIEHGASLTTANANGWTAHQVADFKVALCSPQALDNVIID